MLSNKPFLFRSFTVSKITALGGHLQLKLVSDSKDDITMIVKKIAIKEGSRVDLLFSKQIDPVGALYAIHGRSEQDDIVTFKILCCSAQGHLLPSEQHMGTLKMSKDRVKDLDLRSGFTMCVTPMWSVFDLIDNIAA